MLFQLLHLSHERLLSKRHQILQFLRHQIASQTINLFLQGPSCIDNCAEVSRQFLIVVLDSCDLFVFEQQFVILNSKFLIQTLNLQMAFVYFHFANLLDLLLLFLKLLLSLLNFASKGRILLRKSQDFVNFQL